jgi:hypothetical protein
MRRAKFDIEKDKRWRKIIADWQASGLNMTAFCRRENVKLGSLCDWRRTIQRRDAEAAGKSRKPSLAKVSPQPVRTTDSDTFVPVVLTGPTNSETLEAAMEITLRSGTRVAVREHCSPGLLASVLRLLEVAHV